MTDTPCIGNDPFCPCQDGDLCHYKDSRDGKTKAMTTDLVRRLRATWLNDARFLTDAAAVKEGADFIERLSAPAEPVGSIDRQMANGRSAWITRTLPVGTMLYAHPAAPAPDYDYEVDRSQINSAAPAPAQTLAEWKQQAQDFLDAPAPDAATLPPLPAFGFHAVDQSLDELADDIRDYAVSYARAAVERVVQEANYHRMAAADNKKWFDAANERAERAEAERDALKAVSEKYLEQSGINLERAERAEAAYEQVRQDCRNLTEKVIPGIRERAERNAKDAARLDFLHAEAQKYQVMFAKSLYGTGIELALGYQNVRVVNGDLRAAIDSAMKEQK